MPISQTLLNLQENNTLFVVKTSSFITFRLPVLLGTSTITMHMNSSVYFDYQRFSIRLCRKRVWHSARYCACLSHEKISKGWNLYVFSTTSIKLIYTTTPDIKDNLHAMFIL